MDTAILEQVGLSKNEIKVYFALLELKQASATPIVKKARIPHSKLYPVVEKLMEKGLVSHVIKNNVRYFQASSALHLIDFIGQKESELAQQKDDIKALIPEIEERRKTGLDLQNAEVYEGIKGVKTALLEQLYALKRGESYCVFMLGDEIFDQDVKRFFDNYHAKREELGVKVRIIGYSRTKDRFKKTYHYKGMDQRFSDIKMPTGIFIYESKIINFVWGKTPTAFVITSRTNALRYREFFEAIWKTARA